MYKKTFVFSRRYKYVTMFFLWISFKTKHSFHTLWIKKPMRFYFDILIWVTNVFKTETHIYILYLPAEMLVSPVLIFNIYGVWFTVKTFFSVGILVDRAVHVRDYLTAQSQQAALRLLLTFSELDLRSPTRCDLTMVAIAEMWSYYALVYIYNSLFSVKYAF